MKLNSLEHLGIRSYRIEKDGTIIVKQDVEWNGKGYESIPVKIHRVEGNFYVKGNRLTDFTNFPQDVLGMVNLSYNCIESFETYPQDSKVTQLLIDSNHLTSLKGLSKNIKHLSVDGNPLTSIEHAPCVSTLFINNTKLSDEDIIIYKTACSLNLWKQELSLFENFKHLIRNSHLIVNSPPFSETARSFKIFKDHEQELKISMLNVKFGL